MKFRLFLIFVVIFSFFIYNLEIGIAEPNGANVTSGSSTSSTLNQAPGNSTAYSGNITALGLNGMASTQSWQGYYGNVTGNIQLADASNRVFYNWSSVTSQGEIYASTNNTVSWTGIQCFNFTANATGSSGSAGGTNQAGVNLTVLESMFNIGSTDADGVNETFTLQDHDQFFTANLQFSANECTSTRVYNNGGSGVDQQFEEVLLYEPTTASVVFTSIIEDSLTGFNGGSNDFEMLVLEDGHSANTALTTYYFYTELG